MTKLLQRAFEKASSLPQKEQDSLAEWLLEELASDARWERAFDGSESRLSVLAAEALDEHRQGQTIS